MTEKWLTFDCYGTMIDWKTGMSQALEAVSPGRSLDLIAAYHDLEPELQAEVPFKNYREVLTLGLERAAIDSGIRIADEQYSVLADSLPTWPAFAHSSSPASSSPQ